MTLMAAASPCRKILAFASKILTETVVSLFGKYLYRSNELFSCLFAQFALMALYMMPILVCSSRDWPAEADGKASNNNRIDRLIPPITVLHAYLLPTLFFTGGLSAKKKVTQIEGPGIQGLITAFQALFSALMQWIYFDVGIGPLSVISLSSSMACYLSSFYFVSDWMLLILSTLSCVMVVFRNVYTKKHSKDWKLDTVQALYVTCLLMMPCLFTARCLIVTTESLMHSESVKEALWQVLRDHRSALTENLLALCAYTLLTGWGNLMVFWILANCNPLSLTISNQVDALLTITLDLFGVDVFFLDILGIDSSLFNNNHEMTTMVWVGYFLKLGGAICYICDQAFMMLKTGQEEKEEALQYKTNCV